MHVALSNVCQGLLTAAWLLQALLQVKPLLLHDCCQPCPSLLHQGVYACRAEFKRKTQPYI
jgi:hypothetical protein